MTRFSSLLVLATIFCITAHGQNPGPVVFELEDQYGHPHVVRFPLSQSVHIWVLADRAGSAQVREWVQALYGRYGDRIPIQGIAALPDVPAYFRLVLRALFRHNAQQPLWLDWGSKLSQYYAYQPGCAVVLVLNSNGNVVHRNEGPATREQLERCFQAIDAYVSSTAGCE